jgi:hypothetical protein
MDTGDPHVDNISAAGLQPSRRGDFEGPILVFKKGEGFFPETVIETTN